MQPHRNRSHKGEAFLKQAKIDFANRLWQKTIKNCRQAIQAGLEEADCYKMLAKSLEKQQKWNKAIAAYTKVIELTPTDSDAYCGLGNILRKRISNLENDLAFYKKTLEKLPDYQKLAASMENALAEKQTKPQQLQVKLPVFTAASEYSSYAENQKNLGNFNEAIAGYRKAIEIQPQAKYYYELGMLLVQTRQQWDEAFSCYEILLEIKPWVDNHLRQCISLGTVLIEEGHLEKVINSFHNVFQKNVENVWYYWRFSLQLSNLKLLEAAVTFFDELPKPQPPKLNQKNSLNLTDNGSKYDSIWDYFNSVNVGEFNLNIDLESLPLEADKIRQHFQNKTISVFVLPHLTIEDKILLRERGISEEYVTLMKLENPGLENIYLNVFDSKNSSNTSGFIERNILHPHRHFRCWHRVNTPVEFPHTIAEFKYMYCLDPTSGQVVRSNESFFWGSSIVYRFKGKEVFYIVAGGFSGDKVSLYVPSLNLIIFYNDWDAPADRNYQFFKDFQCLIVTYFKDVLEYLSSSNSRKLTSCLGFINNLGHYFWQELNGLYYSYKNNLLDKIDGFALGDYEQMELKAIIPEIPESKILKVSGMSESEKLQFFLKNNCFCFRITEHFIAREAMDRVRNAALNKCSADFISMLTNIKENKEAFPLLWINVRSHNKSWISQDEGYANIINKLSDLFPNLGIVFDGWIDCNEVVERIKSKLKSNIKVYNTLGCSLHESIVWGYYIDAYIAVVGSGLTITSWLNDKPGVAYANKGHLGQNIFWSQVKEKAIAPTFLEPENVVDVGIGGWGNYELDWQVIYNKILPILQKIPRE